MPSNDTSDPWPPASRCLGEEVLNGIT
jgi:hypothetical protein